MSGMRRREFITLIGGAAAWPALAHAQQRGERQRLGVLTLGLQSDAFGKGIIAGVLQGLDALGWKERVNLLIDCRCNVADAALPERQVAKLIALNPDPILAHGNPAVTK